jgi:Co/Zn/Cd efflux system component
MLHPKNTSQNGNSFNWGREELLGLLSNSANLAGLCVTVVALMNTFDRSNAAATIVDDMFAVCAALYVICTYIIFWALRSLSGNVPAWLMQTIDGIFLLALTAMTSASFLLIYAVW